MACVDLDALAAMLATTDAWLVRLVCVAFRDACPPRPGSASSAVTSPRRCRLAIALGFPTCRVCAAAALGHERTLTWAVRRGYRWDEVVQVDARPVVSRAGLWIALARVPAWLARPVCRAFRDHRPAQTTARADPAMWWPPRHLSGRTAWAVAKLSAWVTGRRPTARAERARLVVGRPSGAPPA